VTWAEEWRREEGGFDVLRCVQGCSLLSGKELGLAGPACAGMVITYLIPLFLAMPYLKDVVGAP